MHFKLTLIKRSYFSGCFSIGRSLIGFSLIRCSRHDWPLIGRHSDQTLSDSFVQRAIVLALIIECQKYIVRQQLFSKDE